MGNSFSIEPQKILAQEIQQYGNVIRMPLRNDHLDVKWTNGIHAEKKKCRWCKSNVVVHTLFPCKCKILCNKCASSEINSLNRGVCLQCKKRFKTIKKRLKKKDVLKNKKNIIVIIMESVGNLSDKTKTIKFLVDEKTKKLFSDILYDDKYQVKIQIQGEKHELVFLEIGPDLKQTVQDGAIYFIEQTISLDDLSQILSKILIHQQRFLTLQNWGCSYLLIPRPENLSSSHRELIEKSMIRQYMHIIIAKWQGLSLEEILEMIITHYADKKKEYNDKMRCESNCLESFIEYDQIENCYRTNESYKKTSNSGSYRKEDWGCVSHSQGDQFIDIADNLAGDLSCYLSPPQEKDMKRCSCILL